MLPVYPQENQCTQIFRINNSNNIIITTVTITPYVGGASNTVEENHILPNPNNV